MTYFAIAIDQREMDEIFTGWATRPMARGHNRRIFPMNRKPQESEPNDMPETGRQVCCCQLAPSYSAVAVRQGSRHRDRRV
jgi:hypothetical protein